YLERIYPAFGNLVPRDIASRQAKNVCDEGRGVGPGGLGVYLDFGDAMERLGRKAIEAKYGNLFDMYAQITGEDPYEVPMRIYPAVHYVMGGLWVDYDLLTTIPGLCCTGGVAHASCPPPPTIRHYLADGPFTEIADDPPAVVEARESVQKRIDHFMNVGG